jgi:hypothetical protein
MGDSGEEAGPLLLDGVASPNVGNEVEDYGGKDFLFDLSTDGTISEDVRCGDDTTNANNGKVNSMPLYRYHI